MDSKPSIFIDPSSRKVLYDHFSAIQNKCMSNSPEDDATTKSITWERWWKGLVRLKRHNIPAPVPVQNRELLLFQLDKTDPRGIFAGKMVSCCLHPYSNGEECAWHGHESPNGAFWVIERFGAIIAVAWVWRYEHNLVINAVDIATTLTGRRIISASKRARPMFRQAAKSVVGRLGIGRVYVGSAGNQPWGHARATKRSFPAPASYMHNKILCDDSAKVHLIAHI